MILSVRNFNFKKYKLKDLFQGTILFQIKAIIAKLF